MADVLNALGRIVAVLTDLLPILAWVAWWLCAADWKKLWPVLRAGAWAPVVLLLVMAAVVWSRIMPGPNSCLGFVVPSPVWQLGAVAGLAVLALFCGWLQGRLGWGPAEISVEPPAAADDGHGHHH